MEEYIEKLISQIRCKKARPYIADEIRNHIEKQIEDNKLNGMTSEEAEKCAVIDMGDPIDVGVSMDKIHRPRISWKILIVVGILSILGIVIQYSSLNLLNSKPQINELYQSSVEEFISSIILGFIIMIGIYFIDFTTIARYSKLIGVFIIISGCLCLTGICGASAGTYQMIRFGVLRFSLTALMMFYVPIYGAILYKYRDGGKLAFFKAIFWMVVPVIMMFMIPNVVGTGIMFISMMVMLSISLLKGWFKIKTKRTLVGLWTVFLIIPVGLLFSAYSFHILQTHQEARIRAFLSASGDEFYVTTVLRTLCDNVKLVGNTGNDVAGSLPDFNRDYIFSYILNSYGSVFGIGLVAILALLVMFIFSASLKQKNELGMMMGFGCGMILLLNILINILVSIGIFPQASSFLPFFSLGRSNMVLSYALIGIVLSIYRYKDVYPKDVIDKVRMDKRLLIK